MLRVKTSTILAMSVTRISSEFNAYILKADDFQAVLERRMYMAIRIHLTLLLISSSHYHYRYHSRSHFPPPSQCWLCSALPSFSFLSRHSAFWSLNSNSLFSNFKTSSLEYHPTILSAVTVANSCI